MKTYVIGHKNPDTDSIVSAICYADFKIKNGVENIVPARIGEISNESRYVLKKFGAKEPELIADGSGKRLILVDHNQEFQSIDNLQESDVVEVLDHHNIKFSYNKPILFHTEIVGATATLIAEKYFQTNTEISKEIAGLLLAAIITDCVIFKSPVTTERDKEISIRLGSIAGIDDITSFGMELFKAKSVWGEMTAADIVEMDRKEYDMGGKKVSVAQVETVDYSDLKDRKSEFIQALENINAAGNAVSIVLITDIIREGCLLIATGELEMVEKAFGKKLDDNEVWLDGVLSRKEQVIPVLEKSV